MIQIINIRISLLGNFYELSGSPENFYLKETRMKKVLFRSIISIILLFTVTSLSAQEKSKKVETTKFVVKGNCGMCKDRIENAALLKGVKFVEWDKVTDTLTVIYRIDKVEVDDLYKAVAEVGHDTEKVKAKDEIYNKLPACCLYRNGDGKH
jgi:hypothetical protein